MEARSFDRFLNPLVYREWACSSIIFSLCSQYQSLTYDNLGRGFSKYATGYSRRAFSGRKGRFLLVTLRVFAVFPEETIRNRKGSRFEIAK